MSLSLSPEQKGPWACRALSPVGGCPDPPWKGWGAEPGPAPSPPPSQGLGAAWLAASADAVFRRIPALGPLQPESRAIPSCPLGPRASVSARRLPASQPRTQRGQRPKPSISRGKVPSRPWVWLGRCTGPN